MKKLRLKKGHFCKNKQPERLKYVWLQTWYFPTENHCSSRRESGTVGEVDRLATRRAVPKVLRLYPGRRTPPPSALWTEDSAFSSQFSLFLPGIRVGVSPPIEFGLGLTPWKEHRILAYSTRFLHPQKKLELFLENNNKTKRKFNSFSSHDCQILSW